MVEKYFTPKAANELLPTVKKIVGEILSRAQVARSLLSLLERSDEQTARLNQLGEQVKDLISKLEDMGCAYKDWNFQIGLVDFPAIIHGRKAWLCWRSDEEKVEWYHGYEEGYAGRQRITKDLIIS